MTTNIKSRRAESSAQSAVGSLAQAGESALDSTRQFAGQAFEKASEKARDLREGVKDLASKSYDSVSIGASAAKKGLVRYADVTGRYVSDQPVRSALIAAGIGAVIAGLLIAARRRSKRFY